MFDVAELGEHPIDVLDEAERLLVIRHSEQKLQVYGQPADSRASATGRYAEWKYRLRLRASSDRSGSGRSFNAERAGVPPRRRWPRSS